jgi:hypothetical protein
MTATLSLSDLRDYVVNCGWTSAGASEGAYVFFIAPAGARHSGQIMLPKEEDASGDGAEHVRKALQTLAHAQERTVDAIVRDVWPEQRKRMDRGASFGPDSCLVWERESGDYTTREHLLYEVVKHRESDIVVGWIEKFYNGGPTYAWAKRQRLGGFITIAGAVHAVETALADFDAKQVLS